MKSKNKKHLEFHKQCMETGLIPVGFASDNTYYGGLCQSVDEGLIDKEKFDLFSEGQYDRNYWGHEDAEISFSFHRLRSEYTPLRQTIVLLIAAMNNEL